MAGCVLGIVITGLQVDPLIMLHELGGLTQIAAICDLIIVLPVFVGAVRRP